MSITVIRYQTVAWKVAFVFSRGRRLEPNACVAETQIIAFFFPLSWGGGF